MTQPEWKPKNPYPAMSIGGRDGDSVNLKYLGFNEGCRQTAHKIAEEIEKQMLHKPNDELFVSNGCYLISIGNWEQFQREVGLDG